MRIMGLWSSGWHSSKTLLQTNDVNREFNFVRICSKSSFVGNWQPKFIIYIEVLSGVAWSEDWPIHSLSWINLKLVLFNDIARSLPDEMTKLVCSCRHTRCGCVNQFFFDVKASIVNRLVFYGWDCANEAQSDFWDWTRAVGVVHFNFQFVYLVGLNLVTHKSGSDIIRVLHEKR